MKPWCHNRPDREEVGRWVDTGRVSPAGAKVRAARIPITQNGPSVIVTRLSSSSRPILRWRRAFHDINACMAYTVPEGTVPAPVLSGWDCSGCKHLPWSAK